MTPRNWSWSNWRAIAAALIGMCILILAPIDAAVDELPAGHKRHRPKGEAFSAAAQFQVAGGSEAQARKYYREVVARQTGFETEATIEGSKIKSLLAYFGYSEINARDLHKLSSDQLMALSADGDILATRFFAPKITDVQDKPADTPKGGFGWRKLVRLKAKSGSPADTNGMQAVYILQNVFEASASGDPFIADKNVSKFNQAIMTRKIPSEPAGNRHAAYFFAYDPLVKVDGANQPIKVDGEFQDAGEIAFKLQATFDESDRNPETNSEPANYFVPRSCVQCHGGESTTGKLNFLDTDHWFDRVTPAYGLADARFSQEDFTVIGQSTYGVLYDGGTDTTSAKFGNAFGVIRKLNEEIGAQNADVGGDNPENFQRQAVAKWLDLHKPAAFDSKHVPPYDRGFGSELWNSTSNNERTLLYYLNRYCYRCHSSVKFNIFDRQTVRKLVPGEDGIEKRVLEIEVDYRWMPQDRIFSGLAQTEGKGEATGDLKEFLDFLKQLQ